MGFSRTNETFAAIYVHLAQKIHDAPYKPILATWDTETRSEIACCELPLGDCWKGICLVDRLHFSEDGEYIKFGIWKFWITEKVTHLEIIDAVQTFAGARAILMSPDCGWTLRLEEDVRRILFRSDPRVEVTFSKPSYYRFSPDAPTMLERIEQTHFWRA